MALAVILVLLSNSGSPHFIEHLSFVLVIIALTKGPSSYYRAQWEAPSKSGLMVGQNLTDGNLEISPDSRLSNLQLHNPRAALHVAVLCYNAAALLTALNTWFLSDKFLSSSIDLKA